MTLISRIAAMVGSAAIVFAAPNALAQQSGSIRGRVTDSRTHSAISNARVAIVTPERITLTDAQGNYVLREVPAGTYKVYTSAIGRAADSSSVTVTAGGATMHDVTLGEGSLLLSGVVVSATRTATEASKVASTVNVLTPEQVRQSPAREAQDLLREVPAVELPRTSSLVGGTAQIVSIRGVDEGRTAVLFDGVPVNDAWGEWIDWGRIPKAMLDRVEVVEGGTSSLYGNGAMGGLISFYSRPLAPGAVQAQIDAGSRDARHGYIAAGIPLVGALSANVNGDYQEKGGYKLIGQGAGPADISSDIIQRNSYARLNYSPSANWSAYVTGHIFSDNRALGTALTYANRDQKNFDLGFNHSSLLNGSLAVRAWDGRLIESQRSSALRTVSGVARAAEDSSLTAQIPSHDWGGSVQWTRSNAWHLESFAVGADYRHYQGNFNETDFSTSNCPRASSPTSTCGNLTQFVSSGGAQALSGAFVQAIASPVSKLRVELSGRVDQWNNTDAAAMLTPATNGTAGTPNRTTYADKSAGAFSPRVGALYQLHQTFSIRAAAYKAFRAPNLAELYRKQVSPTSVTIPNPSLSSENAFGREVGFDWQPIDWFQTRGTWYVADYNNFNVPTNLPTATVPKPAECPAAANVTCRTRLNVTKVRSEGGEAYVAIRPISQLFISAGANYDDARQQSALPFGTQNSQKPHVNRVPSPKQTIRGTWTSPMFGDWTAVWRHEGQTTTLQGAPLAPYTVVDGNVQREVVPGLRGFLSVENIGNKNYMINIAGSGATAVITNGLPRTVRVGVEAFRF